VYMQAPVCILQDLKDFQTVCMCPRYTRIAVWCANQAVECADRFKALLSCITACSGFTISRSHSAPRESENICARLLTAPWAGAPQGDQYALVSLILTSVRHVQQPSAISIATTSKALSPMVRR
jgi:hypothetical protein